MIRFGGYLGFVLFLGVLAMQVVGSRTAGSRDVAADVTAAGYLLMLVRLGVLAMTSDREATRRLARVTIGGMLAVWAFVGISLLMTSQTTV